MMQPMQGKTSKPLASGSLKTMIVTAVVVALLIMGVWLSADTNKQDMSLPAEFVQAAPTHDKCMDKLGRKWRSVGDASLVHLATQFEIGRNARISLEKSDGRVRECDLANVGQLAKEWGHLNLVNRDDVDHKTVPISPSRKMLLFSDNTVVDVDTSTCQVDGVYMTENGGVHSRMKWPIQANMAVAKASNWAVVKVVNGYHPYIKVYALDRASYKVVQKGGLKLVHQTSTWWLKELYDPVNKRNVGMLQVLGLNFIARERTRRLNINVHLKKEKMCKCLEDLCDVSIYAQNCCIKVVNYEKFGDKSGKLRFYEC